MIECRIIGPTLQRLINVSWIGVTTPTGNLIIQEGHAPAIMILSPFKKIEFGFADGSVESIELQGGILQVERTRATIIVNE